MSNKVDLVQYEQGGEGNVRTILWSRENFQSLDSAGEAVIFGWHPPVCSPSISSRRQERDMRAM